MESSKNMSRWPQKLSEGDEQAIEQLCHRYFQRLLRLALKKMSGLDKVIYSEEDIAMTVLRTVCIRLREGKIWVKTEESLRGALLKITLRKIKAERTRQRAKKRLPATSLCRESDFQQEDSGTIFDILAGRDPSPDLVLEMAENADALFKIFSKSPQKEIISLHLQGYNNREISQKTHLVPSTITWHLQQIRQKWFFLQAMEFLVKNALGGMKIPRLASLLGCDGSKVERLLRCMRELWVREKGSSQETLLLEMMMERPQDYRRLLEKDDREACSLESRTEKIAEEWIGRIYASYSPWKIQLQKIWQSDI